MRTRESANVRQSQEERAKERDRGIQRSMATSEKTEKAKTEEKQAAAHHPHHRISEMRPVTEGAYGGGLYGTDAAGAGKPARPPASETQSADGPPEPVAEPRHKPPPSTGDVDVDVTGQSYFQ